MKIRTEHFVLGNNFVVFKGGNNQIDDLPVLTATLTQDRRSLLKLLKAFLTLSFQ